MPADAVYVEETITHAGMLQQHLPWSQPRSFFRAGGGLGQGLGTALGVKLGAPKRPVAALPAELPGAIRTAMRAVNNGKTAILNVVLSR